MLCLLASQVRPIAPHTLSHVRPLPPLTHLPPGSGDRDRVSVELEAEVETEVVVPIWLTDTCLYTEVMILVGFTMLTHRRWSFPQEAAPTI